MYPVEAQSRNGAIGSWRYIEGACVTYRALISPSPFLDADTYVPHTLAHLISRIAIQSRHRFELSFGLWGF